MKYRVISVKLDYKMNVGGYESVSPFIELSAELEDGDDLEECYSKLRGEAQNLWNEEAKINIKEIIKIRKKRGMDFKSLVDLYNSI